MIPKPFKNESKLRQKAFKIQAWRHQNRGPEGSGAGLEASLAVLGHPGRFWRHLGSSWRGFGGLLGRLGPRKVANMGPSCSPRRSQNRWKIDIKIDQFFDASWNRFLDGFWCILDAKMELSWHKNGIKNRCYQEKIKKNWSNNEAKMGIALGIDFSWIFFDFGRQVGAKLASKIDKKSIQKSIKNMMRKKRHLDASWRRLGPVLACWVGTFHGRAEGGAGFMGPPNWQFSRKPNTRQQS